jgi:hypothetical protein
MARAYLHTGHIQADDLVWNEDQSIWMPAHDHPLLKDSQPPPPPLKSSPPIPIEKSAGRQKKVGGWLLLLCIFLTIGHPLGTVVNMVTMWSFDTSQFAATGDVKEVRDYKVIWIAYQEEQAKGNPAVEGMTLHDYAKALNEETKSHNFDAALYPNVGKYIGAEVERALDAIGITTTADSSYAEPILCSLFFIASGIWFFITGLNLWRLKPTAVIRAKYLLVFMGVFPMLTILIIRMDSMPFQIRDYVTNSMAYQIIPQLIWATVWYLYLTHSKRVRETFRPLNSG